MTEGKKTAQLPQRLEDLLSSLAGPAKASAAGPAANPELSRRLRRVYEAGALALAGLSDADLLSYEGSAEPSGPDLALWEEMAPIIRDMVVAVNSLLLVLREEFSERPLPAADAQAARVGPVLLGGMTDLAAEVTRLGEQMRRPDLMSDRWALLAELQTFRTRFRSAIGRLIFESAVLLGDVSRIEVVPFHADEVAAARELRASVVDLRRLVEARTARVAEAEPEDVAWNLRQAAKELDAFGRTPAYGRLRAQDKRRIIECRQQLRELEPEGALSRESLLAALQPFSAFVEELAAVKRREELVEHDLEVRAACGVALERAQRLLATEPPEAARALEEALSLAWGLYGVSPSFDAFLRASRKQLQGDALEQPSAEQLAEQVSRFLTQLVELDLA